MTTSSANILSTGSAPQLYVAHFGMRRKPFGGADPRLMIGAAAETVFERLLAGVRRPGGLVVLSGEAGTGKTLMLRRLMQQAGDGLEFVLCYSTQLSFNDLLGFICDRLNLDAQVSDRSQRLAVLGEHLRRRARQGGAVVLLVDEAQHLGEAVLGELFEQVHAIGKDNQALRLVLAGAPVIGAQLASQPLAAAAVHCRLEPLTETQVVDYVHRQVRAAGGQAEHLFPPPVAARIAMYSNGIPRLINALCDHALVLAQFTGEHRVTESMIDEVADELMLGRPAARDSDALPAPEPALVPPPVAEDEPVAPPRAAGGSEPGETPAPPPDPTDAGDTAAGPADRSPAPGASRGTEPSLEQTLPQPTQLTADTRSGADAEDEDGIGATETLPAMTVDSERTASLPVVYTAGGQPTRRVSVVKSQAVAQPRRGAVVWYLGVLLLVIGGGGAWLWYRSLTPGFLVEPQAPAEAVQTPSPLAPDPAGEALRRDASPPRLQIGEARGRADQFIPLAIAVQGDPRDTFTIDIAGLPRGATLSAGRQYSNGTWTLTSGELDGLALRPGGEYGGALTLKVIAIAIPPYRGQSASTEAELTVFIEPMPQAPAARPEPEPPAAVAAGPGPEPIVAAPAGPESEPAVAEPVAAPAGPESEPAVAGPVAAPAGPESEPAVAGPVAAPAGPGPEPIVAAPAGPGPEPAVAGPAPVEPSPAPPAAEAAPPAPGPVAAAPAPPATPPAAGPGRERVTGSVAATPSVAAFMDSGNRLMALGDLASARLFYEAAAQTGDPEAALAVGRTYDPVVLDQRGLRGVYADPLLAAQWYRKAREAGAGEAGGRLAALARWLEKGTDLSPEQAQDLRRLLP